MQHHPSRAEAVAELLPRLDGLDPQVVTDPGGPKLSPWRCHRLCLASIGEDATHLLILQDDAWPCAGFPDLIRAAIARQPDRIITAFLPGFSPIMRRVNVARKAGARWVTMDVRSFVPLVAVVYPAEHARAILAFTDAKKVPIHRADDAVIAGYCRANRVPVVAPLPCLVEHRDELPSVMRMPSGRGAAHRLAAWYDGDPVPSAV